MPVLDSTNYAYWKQRMRTHLKSIDIACWEACMTHFVPPLKEADKQGDKLPVPYAEYTPAQKSAQKVV